MNTTLAQNNAMFLASKDHSLPALEELVDNAFVYLSVDSLAINSPNTVDPEVASSILVIRTAVDILEDRLKNDHEWVVQNDGSRYVTCVKDDFLEMVSMCLVVHPSI